MTPPAPRRCAIYTRKSSEEGLEQSFNSLHAQREACEAYIKSQAGEGWSLVKTAYDDGGFSGGNLDRPALKELLEEVEQGQVDVVVVYKVDRLTRSLTDFARIVEIFDRKGVSFVSVTQAFNTTTSMGRLTLNVLLSFAQFEREVTGERIRDKIAASKAKGLWMGGVLPLGYQVQDKRLAILEPEAQTVRMIFRRYLELGSVRALRQELRAQGISSKAWTSRAGRPMGDQAFSTGALRHLLRNRHYLGDIKHKELCYPGQHPPIIPVELFEAVQAHLDANRVRKQARTTRAVERSPLKGLVFSDGRPLTPSFSKGRKARIYRYYIIVGDQPAQDPAAAPCRLPAEPFEALILQHLRRISRMEELTPADLPRHIRRIDLRGASLELVVRKAALLPGLHPALALDELDRRLDPGERAVAETGDAKLVRISLPIRVQFRGGRTWLSGLAPTPGLRRPKTNPRLVRALRSSHSLLKSLEASPLESVMRATAGPTNTYLMRLARLAFLAPDIQLDILAGRQPASLSAKDLLTREFPLSWNQQRRWLGELENGPNRRSEPKIAQEKNA